MFGHVEEPWELAEHLRVVRALQERTGGITEFVPLSFIPYHTMLGRTHGVEELSVRGAYGATHRQYRITMDYLDRKQDELAKVVTHRWPLEEIGEAFETIRAGTGLKMVVLP